MNLDGEMISLQQRPSYRSKREKEEKKDEKVVYSERSYGMVSRSFSLPSEVDEKAAKAEYKDGVLKLVLPKKANGNGHRVSIA